MTDRLVYKDVKRLGLCGKTTGVQLCRLCFLWCWGECSGCCHGMQYVGSEVRVAGRTVPMHLEGHALDTCGGTRP